MATSNFPAYVTKKHGSGEVEEYAPGTAGGEPFVPGSIVVAHGTNGMVKLAGADPTAIYGISEVDSAKALTLTPNGKVPIRVLTPSLIVAMACATAYVEATHRNQEYGVVLVGNNWLVDVSDVVNVRVIVLDCDIPSNTWFVKFRATNLVLDGIAS